MTELVHGSAASQLAQAFSDYFFPNRPDDARQDFGVATMDKSMLRKFPRLTICSDKRAYRLSDILIKHEFVKSRNEARRLIKAAGVSVNQKLVMEDLRLDEDIFAQNTAFECFATVHVGKKNQIALVEFTC